MQLSASIIHIIKRKEIIWRKFKSILDLEMPGIPLRWGASKFSHLMTTLHLECSRNNTESTFTNLCSSVNSWASHSWTCTGDHELPLLYWPFLIFSLFQLHRTSRGLKILVVQCSFKTSNCSNRTEKSLIGWKEISH
jgi:hypothetical protein